MKRLLIFLPLLPLAVAGYFLLEDMVTKRRTAAHIIMVGDSYVAHFPQDKLPIVFSGRENETTASLLTRIADVADEQPKKIVLEVGYNDLKAGASLDSVQRNYVALIHTIREHSPTTRIYLQDILPGKHGDAVNGAVYRFNTGLPALAEAEKVTYQPISDLLAPRGFTSAYEMEGNGLSDHAYFMWKWRLRRRMTE
jgi:lysophospholipase L1-like esterase